MPFPSTDELYTTAKRVLQKVHRAIEVQINRRPERALSYMQADDKEASNQPLRIDELAEDTCNEALLEKFGKYMIALGEESLGVPEAKDLAQQDSVVAVMDMIDGTDLLLRGLGNWCSAMTLFVPKKRQILLAMVLDPAGTVFHANNVQSEAFYQRRNAKHPVSLHVSHAETELTKSRVRFHRGFLSGPRATTLRNASVCCNSQKASALSRFLKQPRLHKQIATAVKTGQTKRKDQAPAPTFRHYNLSGIPMMVKLATGAVDAVIELGSQKPHDVVTGAYIAIKAGAIMKTIRGKIIGEEELVDGLLQPGSRFDPYVLASCSELADELLEALKPVARAVRAVAASDGPEPLPIRGS